MLVYKKVMILIFKKIRWLLGGKFFLRVFLIYLFIIILISGFLSFYILSYNYKQIESTAIMENSKNILNIRNYLNTKISSCNQIFQQLYNNKDQFSSIFDLLEYSFEPLTVGRYTRELVMENFISNSSGTDKDIIALAMYKKDFSQGYFYAKQEELQGVDHTSIVSKYLNQANTPNILVTPSFYLKTNGYLFPAFAVCLQVKSKDLSKIIGYLVAFYSTSDFSNFTISSASSNVNRIIVSNGTAIIFDSKLTIPKKDIFNISDLKDGHHIFQGKSSIIEVLNYDLQGIKITGIIDDSALSLSFSKTSNFIIFFTIIVIIIILIISFVIMSLFSAKVNKIIKGMENVKSGDLSYRIKVKSNSDEFSNIALNFNQMCDVLNEYIEKVYLLEINQKDALIKQKTTDMYVLQSQINPHFLYNTLEVIRMKAIIGKNESVGKMIEMLANLFRNAVKADMIVTIEDELYYCNSYLELYRLRFENYLHVEFEIDDAVRKYGIIKYILQPLVENSIIHGFDMDKENYIVIKANKIDDDIIFQICDNGKGIDSETLSNIDKYLNSDIHENTNHIGIINVDHRIKLIFGENYGVQVKSEKNIGTTITLKISAKMKKEFEIHVQSSDS